MAARLSGSCFEQIYADNACNAAAKLGNRQLRIEDLQKALRRRDEARGMLGGIVAKDAFVKARFEMKDAERSTLLVLLTW